MRRRSIWIAAAVATIVVVATVVVIGSLWIGIGDTQISAGGWLAMIAGILVTLGLGVGLMSLVFISSRRGYDELDRHR